MSRSDVAALLFIYLFLFGITRCSPLTKKRKQNIANNALCLCQLQMTSGWTNEVILNIFKRPVAAWGQGKSTCGRVREGCKILCNVMGRRFLESRNINSQSQGTFLGQRLCELHSYRNGYRPINPPGRIVSVSYKLDKCWKQNMGYAVAFKVHGSLCCKPVSPFHTYPFVRLYVWNKDCVDNETQFK